MLEDGNKAPNFEMMGDDGSTIRLSGLKGQVTVLYFYPKDDTSGCTLEAKDFSCLADQFKAAGATVIGVSPDGVESHKKFKKKHELSVLLAADEGREAAGAFGVWVEKSMYGKTYMGVERSTFLIGKTGRIEKSWRKVRVPGHADEVLAAVKALNK